MPSKTSQPARQLEEKRSKWRLFGKSSNKSSERLPDPNQRHSDASVTGNDSHRSSATDESKSLANGSTYNTSPPEAHPVRSSEPPSTIAGDRGSMTGLRMNGTLHNNTPREVHPGLITTQSGIAIEKVFQPQSVLSSSSTPSVRQETYTDPVTGEVTTKTITTVVTETTTTHTTKLPVSPRDNDLDVEEERRLATEYLAVNASRDARAPQYGLKPPPRSRGSLKQGKTPTASPIQEAKGADTSRVFYSSPEREQVDRWSSDYESRSSGRHSSEIEKQLPQIGLNHIDSTQRPGYVPQNDHYRQTPKTNDISRRQPAETRIHAQSSYIDKIAPPAISERQAGIAGAARSVLPSHGLTPPIEEQEQREASPSKRGSLYSFGGILGGKNQSKDSIGAITNSQPEQPVDLSIRGGNPDDELRAKSNTVVKTNAVPIHANGEREGGRY
ncbi:hypothetical protein N0V93_008837 [Gnomoniopsis smithogilvyi]|uniref:Uncharacterized protein n=1 Tax=Gnomoniopsis smithogilvyi TaxID=1191159 RepID=A0A9W9CU22_9PEZI|nr:hypothetical protein N0V93_008837 [Gnomoniopsis smithogilvyi]